MRNESGLVPLGVAVLLKPFAVKKSILELPPSVTERIELLETRAVMVEAGSEAWKDESRPRAVPGDKVIITKMAGRTVVGTADGVTYRLVNDRDVFCKIALEKEDE